MSRHQRHLPQHFGPAAQLRRTATAVPAAARSAACSAALARAATYAAECLEERVLMSAVVRMASGPDAASITTAVVLFRGDLGGAANTTGNPVSGRREINWDAVPAASAAPNALPGNFFNSTSARGAVLSSPTAGTTFQVSGAAADAGTGQPAALNFGNINATYTTTFKPFSSPRLFTPVGGNVTDVSFFVPNAATTAATVRGFGAVFSDVDDPAATTIEFFDASGNSLGKFSAPAADGGLSFLGVSFNAGERAAKVRITTGNTAVGPDDGGAAADVVVMDDFIYSEPVAQGLYRWDGVGDSGALSNNSQWSNPLNWFGDAVPPSGANLEFPAGVTRTDTTDDLAAGTSFGSITIGATAYNFAGNTLTLTNGINFTAGGTAPTTTVGMDLNLTGNEAFNVSTATGILNLSGAITGASGGLTKTGAGVVRMLGRSSNTYGGGTTVNAGRLELSKDAGFIAVPGPLAVGDGTGGAGADVVRLLGAGEIGTSAAVDVFSSGTLDLNGFSQTIGSLQLRTDTASAASVTTGTTPGTLTLGGDVTVVSGGTGATGATISGMLDLGGATRTFTVADGAAAVDLDVSAAISGTSSVPGVTVGLTKAGPGTLRFSGATSNTYTGTTTVNEGTLEGNKNGSPAPVTIPGPLVVGDGVGGAGADVYRDVVSNQIRGGAGSVTVNGSGLFQVNALRQDTINSLKVLGGVVDLGTTGATGLSVGDLQMTGGTVKIGPSSDSLTVTGSVTATSDAAGAATITSTGGRVNLTSATPLAFTINGGVNTLGLDVQAPINAASTVDLSKKGPANMRLGATNTYGGTFKVTEGGLVVDGTLGAVSLLGGLLAGAGKVGAVDATGGGVIGPGNYASLDAVLRTGNLSLGSAAELNMNIDGATAGTQYDQLDVTGTVSVGGAQLRITAGAPPTAGQTFRIINNDGTDPVSGTFAGLPEGAAVIGFGQPAPTFRISYRGGDGNDVVLTAVAGTVSVGDVAQAETDSGQTAFVFPVTRDGDLTQAASVNYFTSGGTAAAGSDFQSASGTVTFLPGQDTQTVVVFVNGDTAFEPDETFSVNLVAPFNLGLAKAQGVGTIQNDDPAPTNHAPVARDDRYSVPQNVALIVNAPGLLGNDSDADGDSMTATLSAAPSHGTLVFNGDGSFNYTPDAGFFGNDTFSYVAHDATTASAPATVTVQVVGGVTSTGGARLVYSGPLSGRTLTVSGGTITAATDLGAAFPGLSIQATGANVVFNASQHLAGLTLGGGATATLSSMGVNRTATNHRVLVTSALSVDTASGSRLDLADNDLILKGGGAAGLASIQSLIGSGYAKHAWNGAGIVTSAAAGKTSNALGYALNDGSVIKAKTTFGPSAEPVGPTDVLVKYTWEGDSNLDGQVSFDDYFYIDSKYPRPSNSTWVTGDFDYNGQTSFDDYFYIDSNYPRNTPL